MGMVTHGNGVRAGWPLADGSVHVYTHFPGTTRGWIDGFGKIRKSAASAAAGKPVLRTYRPVQAEPEISGGNIGSNRR